MNSLKIELFWGFFVLFFCVGFFFLRIHKQNYQDGEDCGL